MTYEVLVGRRVQKSVGTLPPIVARRIRSAIDALADDPRPPGCVKLAGREAWRIRVGDYRVVYQIADALRVVRVVGVGHRSDVYG